VSFENRYRARDGTYRWMLWTATPFTRDRLVYAAARDITERKRAEDKIQRLKEAAEAANRAKSDFLARMSHEMRTPLTAIIGMGDVLDRTLLSSEQRQYLASLQRAGGHLLALINDLLDLSKAESDRLTLENIEFSLFDVLEKTVDIAAVAARKKGVALRREVAPDIPAMLTGDPDRLRQVLINLVSNAIKFTTGGQVVIRVERDPDERDPCILRFSVADSGVGIPEDKLSVIFEAFAQAEASTTRQYGGTGLGLSIAKRFIELMGGRIWVESQVGAGSTFTSP
jgi:signal transduction histidine kinase